VPEISTSFWPDGEKGSEFRKRSAFPLSFFELAKSENEDLRETSRQRQTSPGRYIGSSRFGQDTPDASFGMRFGAPTLCFERLAHAELIKRCWPAELGQGCPNRPLINEWVCTRVASNSIHGASPCLALPLSRWKRLTKLDLIPSPIVRARSICLAHFFVPPVALRELARRRSRPKHLTRPSKRILAQGRGRIRRTKATILDFSLSFPPNGCSWKRRLRLSVVVGDEEALLSL